MTEGTDILYVLKGGSKDNDIALRTSLRSTNRHCSNVSRVYLVGAIPQWVNQQTVICLPMQDRFRVKHKNILNAIMYAVTHSDIGGDSGRFMLASDDHWYMRPTDISFGAMPIYHKGELRRDKDLMIGNVNNYIRSLVETREVLEQFGLETVNYSQHVNTWLNANLMREKDFINIYLTSLEHTTHGCEPTCLVDNYWKKRTNLDGAKVERRQDYKMDDKITTMEEVRADLEFIDQPKRECISGTDRIWSRKIGETLQREFGVKCMYEK